MNSDNTYEIINKSLYDDHILQTMFFDLYDAMNIYFQMKNTLPQTTLTGNTIRLSAVLNYLKSVLTTNVSLQCSYPENIKIYMAEKEQVHQINKTHCVRFSNEISTVVCAKQQNRFVMLCDTEVELFQKHITNATDGVLLHALVLTSFSPENKITGMYICTSDSHNYVIKTIEDIVNNQDTSDVYVFQNCNRLHGIDDIKKYNGTYFHVPASSAHAAGGRKKKQSVGNNKKKHRGS